MFGRNNKEEKPLSLARRVVQLLNGNGNGNILPGDQKEQLKTVLKILLGPVDEELDARLAAALLGSKGLKGVEDPIDVLTGNRRAEIYWQYDGNGKWTAEVILWRYNNMVDEIKTEHTKIKVAAKTQIEAALKVVDCLKCRQTIMVL